MPRLTVITHSVVPAALPRVRFTWPVGVRMNLSDGMSEF